MKWVVVKIVERRLIGCVVGPFETEQAAEDYAEKAVLGCLGYENWIVRELQTPSSI